MTLVLTFLLVTLAVATLMLAVAFTLQPYLYGETVDRVFLRSAACGIVMATFLSFWTFVNCKSTPPDSYGTLFEFNPTNSVEVDRFVAVRRYSTKDEEGKRQEKEVAYVRVPGKVPPEFIEEEDETKTYRLNTSAYMTVALLVPIGEGDPVRFEADMSADGGMYASQDRVFRETRGRRYLESEYPAVVYAPRPMAVVGAILLNLIHFALWYALFWVGMRYTVDMALGLAAGFGLANMLVTMPILFNANR